MNQTAVERVPLRANVLGAQFLDFVLRLVRETVPGWADLNQQQQELVIDRLRGGVQSVLRGAFDVLFREDYPVLAATMGAVSISDTISTKVAIPKGDAKRHALFDNANSPVLLVIGSADMYFKRMNDIKARADQGDLFDFSDEVLELPADVRNELAGEARDESLLAALAQIGYELTPQAIAGWSEAQRDQAHAYALAKAGNASTFYPLPDHLVDLPHKDGGASPEPDDADA